MVAFLKVIFLEVIVSGIYNYGNYFLIVMGSVLKESYQQGGFIQSLQW
jgi:hypothetical protein